VRVGRAQALGTIVSPSTRPTASSAGQPKSSSAARFQSRMRPRSSIATYASRVVSSTKRSSASFDTPAGASLRSV
jgi:hypothetical protein